MSEDMDDVDRLHAWCTVAAEFLDHAAEGLEPLHRAMDIVKELFRRGDITGLREFEREIRLHMAEMSPAQRRELAREMKRRTGQELGEPADGIQEEAAAIRRGFIATEDEYYVLKEREERVAHRGQRAGFNQLGKLLRSYERSRNH